MCEQDKVKLDEYQTIFNNESDVSGVLFNLSGDLLIIRPHCRTTPLHYVNCATRGEIAEFSERSASRMRRYLRECVADYEHMVTLTYPCGYPSDGKEVKEHLRVFLQKIKRDAQSNPGDVAQSFSAFWFLEFQERGAPHFHIFTTHTFNKKWISRIWYDIVGSEDGRHLAAGTRVEQLRAGRSGAAAYASKYAAKLKQKIVPEGYENVGRFWGVTGERSVVSADTFVKHCTMSDPGVQREVSKLSTLINRCLENKKMLCCIRDNGFLILVIRDKKVRNRILMMITNLSLVTGYRMSIFDDAEVEP